MSNTEHRIMEVLNERGQFTAEAYSGQGSEDGFVSGGILEMRAARKLVRKGLASIVNEYNTVRVKGSYTVHIHGLRIAVS